MLAVSFSEQTPNSAGVGKAAVVWPSEQGSRCGQVQARLLQPAEHPAAASVARGPRLCHSL